MDELKKEIEILEKQIFILTTAFEAKTGFTVTGASFYSNAVQIDLRYENEPNKEN